MFTGISRPRPDRDALARVREWASSLLDLGPEGVLIVNELACREANCPPIETVIAVLAPSERRVTVHKPASEVTEDDVKNALSMRHGGESSEGETDRRAPVDRGDAAWDERYASREHVWSGHPNGVLLTEVGNLAPGRALDVGCGEGADAIWLAGRGWDVTAIDVSEVALRRASNAAEQAGAKVQCVHAGLLDFAQTAGTFDLVSAQYPALFRTPGHDAEQALIAAVAPEGLLLVVHHADVDVEQAKAAGFDPADYISPQDVLALLDDRWQIQFDDRRPRQISGGAGSHHLHDVVLRARRSR